MAIKQLSDGSPDGTVLGQSTADLVGFHGVAPIARAAAPTAAATQGGTYVQADVQTIATAVNAIRTALINKGILV